METTGKGHRSSLDKSERGDTNQQASSSKQYDLSGIAKNRKGGVLVTEQEISHAFKFFDADGSGHISTANLRKRLGVFYKDMPAKDYRFLMNNKPDLTEADLKELLLDNEVKDFDPVLEAFKCFDPNNTGFVDIETLKDMFMNIGCGEVTEADLAILIETGDVDKDGKISLDDFRGMLMFNEENPPPFS